MGEENRSLDILGIAGISDSIKIATAQFLDGAAAFLSRVCLPAAEEFGLALRDRVSAWRAVNAARMLSRANDIHLKAMPNVNERISPRLVHVAIEEASWSDDQQIQEMWAGLLATSTSPSGGSDENLMFMNVLKQLSSLQVRIVRFSAENATKRIGRNELPFAASLYVPIEDLPALFGQDLHRIDRELDHMANLGLIGEQPGHGGIHLARDKADLTPTPLALYLYVRAHGSKGTAAAFWNLKTESEMSVG